MDDMFGDIFGNMFHGGTSRKTSSGFGNGFHGGFQSGGFQSKGSDLNAEVTVGFDEAAFGCDKVITLQDPNAPGNPSQSLKFIFLQESTPVRRSVSVARECPVQMAEMPGI